MQIYAFCINCTVSYIFCIFRMAPPFYYLSGLSQVKIIPPVKLIKLFTCRDPPALSAEPLHAPAPEEARPWIHSAPWLMILHNLAETFLSVTPRIYFTSIFPDILFFKIIIQILFHGFCRARLIIYFISDSFSMIVII